MTVSEIVLDQLQTLNLEDQQKVLAFVQALKRSKEKSESSSEDSSSKPLDPLHSEAWSQQNVRRFDLIHKKNRQGLSPEEAAELQHLQTEASGHLRRAFPGPRLETDLLDGIEKRLASPPASRPSL